MVPEFCNPTSGNKQEIVAFPCNLVIISKIWKFQVALSRSVILSNEYTHHFKQIIRPPESIR